MMLYFIKTAPYHITQPSTDNVQIVSPNATSLNLGCSLNVTIPAGIMITWSLNGDVLNTLTIPEDLNTDTILYFGGTPQSGVYQCLFNDSAGYILRGNITVIGTYVCMELYVTITFCMCSYMHT